MTSISFSGGREAERGIRGRTPEIADGRRLFGILVTFRRPRALDVMLKALSSQSKSIHQLLIVDNAPSEENRSIVERHRPQGIPLAYLPTDDNIGPAGAISLGMQHVLKIARDNDWVALFDDDDPPYEQDLLERLWALGAELVSQDEALAGIGSAGSRFDHDRGRLIRTPDDQLIGAVPVDHIGGGQCPLYRVAAIRHVGPYRPELFFGFEELEFGLRLRRAGWSLYAHGDVQLRSRRRLGRLNIDPRPAWSLHSVDWRDYYGVRNLVWICRSQGWTYAALRVSLIQLGKPIANIIRHPVLALRTFPLNLRACIDAWRGKLGRSIEPELLIDGRYREKTTAGQGAGIRPPPPQ